jgi:hypothetical protein
VLLPALAPPSYALVHATSSYKTTALYPLSGFQTFKCRNALALRIRDPSNLDMLQLPLVPWARLLAHMTTISQDGILVSYHGFGHRNVEKHKPLVHGIPDISIHDFLMWLSYRDLSWRPQSLPCFPSRWTVLIASHNFLTSNAPGASSSGLAKCRNLMLQNTDDTPSLPRVSTNGQL